MPDLFLNKPELHYSLQFYMQAFDDLHFDRSIGFGEGYIPITSMFAYGRHYELDNEEIEDLVFFVRAIDIEYVKQQHAKQKKD